MRKKKRANKVSGMDNGHIDARKSFFGSRHVSAGAAFRASWDSSLHGAPRRPFIYPRNMRGQDPQVRGAPPLSAAVPQAKRASRAHDAQERHHAARRFGNDARPCDKDRYVPAHARETIDGGGHGPEGSGS